MVKRGGDLEDLTLVLGRGFGYSNEGEVVTVQVRG